MGCILIVRLSATWCTRRGLKNGHITRCYLMHCEAFRSRMGETAPTRPLVQLLLLYTSLVIELPLGMEF